MAACEISVELDQPERLYRGGEIIRGSVLVTVEKGANCSALEVTTRWSTHGRGNIDEAEVDKLTLFSGSWLAGQEYRYPFELRSAVWPPTYYGTHLNVSHYVAARAKLAWAADPKTQREYTVVATESPEAMTQKASGSQHSLRWLAWLLGGAFLLAFSWFLLFLVPVLLVIGGLVWFFKSYLPGSLLGQVECDVVPARLQPGGVLQASICFTPKRKVQLNGASLTINCDELCESGSGSNRKTHKHSVHQHTESLLAAGELLPGQQQQVVCDYVIPKHLPATLELSDNQLKWQAVLRIDIPKWPDWSKTFPLIVDPLPEIAQVNVETARAARDWLGQVVEQLHAAQSDASRHRIVMDAIGEHVFDVQLEIGERLAASPVSEFEPGTWFDAFEEELNANFALFFPDGFAVPRPHSTWVGQMCITGMNQTIFARATA